MTPLTITALILSAAVFAIWAFFMFRLLFAMRRRAVERSGKQFPGPVDALQEVGNWLRDPAFKKERRQLLFMTVIIICLSYLVALTSTSVP